MPFEEFADIFKLIMRNQSPYFRSLYKRKGHEGGSNGHKPINYQMIIELNQKDIKHIFDAYDVNQNGFIEYEELRELLIDLGLDQLFFDPNIPMDGSEAADEMPEQSAAAFEEYCRAVWNQYDENQDGYISLEEFAPIHSELVLQRPLVAYKEE